MRKTIFLILLGLLAILPASAQQASFVTMTGTNANYPGGTITANFLPPANSSQFDYLKYRFPFTVTGYLSAGGAWSISLADSSSVLPANSQWRLQLCSAGTFGAPTCFTVTTAVTCINNVSCSGSTLDLTASFAGAPIPPGGGNSPSTAPAFIPQNTTAGPSQYLFDDFFNSVNLSTGSIGLPSGQSCAASNANGNVNHPGQIIITSGTGGTGTGEACFLGFSGAGDFNLNTAASWIKESDVFVPVLPGTTAGAYQFGTSNNTSANPWTVGLGFYLSSANSVTNDWYCELSTTYTDSGVAAVASTWTRLTLSSDGTNLHYYINGTQVCGTGTPVSGIHANNMPAGAWTVTALSGTSVTMSVDYLTAYRAVTR